MLGSDFLPFKISEIYTEVVQVSPKQLLDTISNR